MIRDYFPGTLFQLWITLHFITSYLILYIFQREILYSSQHILA